MEKPFSQRAARFLEITNYFLIVPTTLATFGVAIIALVPLLHKEAAGFFVCAAFVAAYAFGTLLLYGYYKHARGKLGARAASRLWVATILFNYAPFAGLLYRWINDKLLFDEWFEPHLFFSFLSFYFLVILLAVLALIYDLRREF